jgi:hypothetical protein
MNRIMGIQPLAAAPVRFGHTAMAAPAFYQGLFNVSIPVTEIAQIIRNRQEKHVSRYRIHGNNGWELVQPNPRCPQVRVMDDGSVQERFRAKNYREIYPAGTVKLA